MDFQSEGAEIADRINEHGATFATSARVEKLIVDEEITVVTSQGTFEAAYSVPLLGTNVLVYRNGTGIVAYELIE